MTGISLISRGCGQVHAAVQPCPLPLEKGNSTCWQFPYPLHSGMPAQESLLYQTQRDCGPCTRIGLCFKWFGFGLHFCG